MARVLCVHGLPVAHCSVDAASVVTARTHRAPGVSGVEVAAPAAAVNVVLIPAVAADGRVVELATIAAADELIDSVGDVHVDPYSLFLAPLRSVWIPEVSREPRLPDPRW